MTRLVLFHPMDPRGTKLGGIETHIRLVLARHPPDMTVLLVGVDEIGDCAPGRVRVLTVEGRAIAFLPVLRADPARINAAARRVGQSLTLRFLLAALRHLRAIARAAGRDCCCEIERVEFAVLPFLLRRRAVLVVHDDWTRGAEMDSLLKRHWRLHHAAERLALAVADRVFAVNASIAARLAGTSARARAEVMSVSVDTGRFVPTPFPAGSTFRVCFAGRLDAFKDPALMMASLATAAARLAARPVGRFDRFAFDYVGASDPARVPGFDRIAGATRLHGPRSAAEVAAIMAEAHAGLITSRFEGMPCYLLEMLASGRPVAAIDLPQFDPLVRSGVIGARVARRDDPAATAAAMADALLAIAGVLDRLDPVAIAALVRPFAVEVQMTRLFACHAALAAGSTPQSWSARAA